jgi:putative intracellular protease/amidase
MSNELKGKRIAILVADGFEQVEMTEPRRALDQAGAEDGPGLANQGSSPGLESSGEGAKVSRRHRSCCGSFSRV